MASSGVPALLEALLICNKTEILDRATKAALRLCNTHFKNLVDATVVEAKKYSDDLNVDLNALINTEWHGLKNLSIYENDYQIQNRIRELPSALFVKFSRLETLVIYLCTALESLPEDIGELSHLSSLEIYNCHITALPTSLSQLTTLEKISLSGCFNLIAEGIAPLQHLTGLTALELGCYNSGKMIKFPDFVFNLTSLKELHLVSTFITTLPDALGNLTNLEKLRIWLGRLKELPESIGNLNALKVINLLSCRELTALPESLDDLLWRKAHETEESKKMELVDFRFCPKLVLSPKMEEALELLEQNGTVIRWP